MQGITKRFPGIVANERIDLQVYAGEIHALLGENGAGKTTLMKILYGLYRPDAGHIWIEGRRVEVTNPQQAMQLGIGMVFQHFTLIPSLTVTENVLLGLPVPRFLLSPASLATRIQALAARYQLAVDPAAYIWQLSVGEQQRVEILKLLYRQARILIFDEPTAVLTPPETASLFSTLRALAEQGSGVLLITHKLSEVMAIADRITVLRQGKVMTTLKREEATERGLVQAMIGQELPSPVTHTAPASGEVVLAVKEVSAQNDKGLPALQRLSFEIRRGEIFGIAGIAGNGQRELSEVIAGLRPATAGRVYIQGRDLTNASPATIIRHGVSYIPEDRLKVGLVPQVSILDNLLLKSYRMPPVAHGFCLDDRAARQAAQHLLDTFQVSAPRLDVAVHTLSGGTLQRLLLARELSTNPVLLLACYPTRGLDVAATEAVHRLLVEQRQRGSAILLVSEDLEEMGTLADRIGVLSQGEMRGIFPRELVDKETIGWLMAGASRPAQREKG